MKLSSAEAKSSSQTARATLRLREMILDGHFHPNERIREIPLAAQLDVSRIPLRLALERLAHEGLLEIRPTRGFVVQQFSTTDIYDAIELRGILEGAAARLAAERLRDGRDLGALREASDEMNALLQNRSEFTKYDAFAKYIELNAKFHSALIDLSRSKILKRALKQACALPFASPSAFLLKQSEGSPDLFFIALDQHRGIVEAISNRESMRAELLAREHARLARRNLDIALDNRELLKSVRGAKLIQI